MERIEKIASLYIAVTGDATPTATELNDYASLSETVTLEAISATLTSGSVLNFSAMPATDLIDYMFTNLFSYTAEELTAIKASEEGQAGYAYWTNELANNADMINVNTLAIALLNGASEADTARATAKSATLVAEYNAANLDPVEPTLPVIEGETYSLTSSTDRDLGNTENNDTYNAYIEQNAFAGGVSNSLSTADHLDGGAGTDTLNVELIQEFIGTNSGDNNDVQPHTTNIEKVTINAIDDNMTTTLDAKNMNGVVSIGSKFSDGDLKIENLTTLADDGVTIRNTSDMTITMDHTDNKNSDNDASDLTVLFDEDYLNTTTSSQGSSLTINMINTLNLKVDNGTSLIEGFDTITFYVGEAVEANLVTVDVQGLELSAVKAAIEAAVVAKGYTDITVDTYVEPAYFGTNIYYETSDTTYAAGSYAGDYTAFIVKNAGSEELVEGGFSLADGQKDGSLAYSQDDNESTVVNAPISINVELEKVGRDGEGGNLVIGGKNQDMNGDSDVDQNDGIEVFNITVKGTDAQPSNLGYISSTNNALKTVNITSEAGSTAALTVREAFNGTDATLNDTNATNVETVNASGVTGAFSIGSTTAMLNVDSFTGSATNTNTVVAAIDGTEAGVNQWSMQGGSVTDTFTVALDGDAVDTIGDDFVINTSAGADAVSVTLGAGVSQKTMAVLDNLAINTSAGDDKVTINAEGNYNISTGSESDFVYVNSQAEGATTGSWTFGDASGTQTFVERPLYNAELTISFAGFEETININTLSTNNFKADQTTINAAIEAAIAANPELSKLLTVTLGTGNQSITINSTVDGANDLAVAIYQPELVVETTTSTLTAGQVYLSSTHVNALEQGIIDSASFTNDSDLLNTEAEIVSYVNGTVGFEGSVANTGLGDNTKYTYTHNDVVVDNGADAGVDILDTAVLYNATYTTSGTDSTVGINYSDINVGSGQNDLIVLDSNAASANNIVFDSEFQNASNKVSIVNFHDVSTSNVTSKNDVGNHSVDFTYFLNNQIDASTDVATDTKSAQTIANTVNIVNGAEAFADSTVGTNTAAANSINVIRFDEADTNADGVIETFASLTAADVKAALNTNTTNYGNLTDALLSATATTVNLVGTTQDHIIMIENDMNEGEYKAYYATSSTTGTATTEFASVTALGTIDFGASVNLNAAGTTEYNNFMTALKNGNAETMYTEDTTGTPVTPVDPVDPVDPVVPTTGTKVISDADGDTTLDASTLDMAYSIDAALSGIKITNISGFDNGDTINTSGLSLIGFASNDADTGIIMNFMDLTDTDPALTLVLETTEAELHTAVEGAADITTAITAAEAYLGEDFFIA